MLKEFFDAGEEAKKKVNNRYDKYGTSARKLSDAGKLKLISEQHRVMVPMKTERMNEKICKRGVKPVPVEVELGARNGDAIRCAKLVLNSDE